MNPRTRVDGGGSLPPRLTRTLREAYAAPTDPRYWVRLEQKIMRRVTAVATETIDGWESAFRVWARAGLLAAGIAAVCAALATWESRTAGAQIAYEAVLDQPASMSVPTDVQFGDVSDQEAILRYVMAP